MKSRKWLALAASVSLVALLTAGFSAAAVQDEDENLTVLMEKVSAANNKLNRSVRTPVAFKKAQQDVVAEAKLLVELGKKARESDEALDKAKVPLDDPKMKWQELMDVFVKHTEELVKTAESGDQAKSKDAHTEVKKACAACHDVFQHLDDF